MSVIRIWTGAIGFVLCLGCQARSAGEFPESVPLMGPDDVAAQTEVLADAASHPGKYDVSALITIATQRHDRLLDLMGNDPSRVIDNALPDHVRAKLPAELQPLLESYVWKRGELEAVIAENPFTGFERTRYSLRSDDTELHLTAENAPVGNEVEVWGVQLAEDMAVAVLEDATASLGDEGVVAAVETVAKPNPTKRTALVLLVRFSDQATHATTVATAQGAIFTNANSTAVHLSEVSEGEYSLEGKNSAAGEVYGPIGITHATTDSPSCTYTNNQLWRDQAMAAAAAQGIDVSGYLHRIIIVNHPGCSWAGLATVGGTRDIWINTTSGNISFVTAHELGHNLFLGHSNQYDCRESAGSAVKVPISTSCTSLGYRDPFDPMGNSGYYQFHGLHKARLGIIPAGSVLEVTSSGVYQIAHNETTPGPETLTPYRLLRVPSALDGASNPTAWYYVDYRQRFGLFDTFVAGSQITQGIMIRRGVGLNTYADVNMIHSEPTLPTSNAPYAASETFYDAARDLTIAQLDRTATHTTVRVTIGPNAGNLPPVASADTYTTPPGQTLLVSSNLGVLSNDSDPDADTMGAYIVTLPTNGLLTLGVDGALRYTPNSGFSGIDSFTYRAHDAYTASAAATVTLSVTSNAAPVANAASRTAQEDTNTSVTLTGSDANGDTLTYRVVTNPAHGSLSGTAPNLTYRATSNYNGSDSFTFVANDGQLDSSAATISITVASVNDAPVMNAATASTNEDTAKTVSLSATDVDGDTLTFSLGTTVPAHGTATISGSTLTYTPTANYNGSDAFTVVANDGRGGTNSATISMSVTAVNDAPTMGAIDTETNEDTALTLPLTASDVDQNPLAFALGATNSTNGVASIVGSTLTYTPNKDFNGTDDLSVSVSDGAGATIDVPVHIVIASVNDSPSSAGPHDFVVDQGLTLIVAAEDGLLAGAADIDGDTLTVAIATDPPSGVLSLESDGSFSYEADAAFAGLVEFTFEVSDGASTITGAATITVNDVTEDDKNVDDPTQDPSEDDPVSDSFQGTARSGFGCSMAGAPAPARSAAMLLVALAFLRRRK